ncbi:MAG TPA: biopolymer transporter ExbD [Candidatus Polarisedimenticolaceae bacterium]|nr:biopolymer transporter ExbD [Candidatus Polarisedimenticolaceae bacterium]
MQLNGGAPGSGLQSEINVTPLVDVVLVLLIIFMVVVPLAMQGYNVNIPRTSAEAVPVQEDAPQLILSVLPDTCGILEPPSGDGLPTDCRVGLADQEIPASQLTARIKELVSSQPPDQRLLFLAADDRLNYEGVLRIVDLAKAGAADLKIGVIPVE